jgi:hypothetical protein
MNDRWAIYIDVEGFSKNYEYSEERKTFAITALGELMTSIYKIGTLCYPGDPVNNFSDSLRLFAYQFGDGFIICSNFPEHDTSRAISIAAAIMRHMIIKGYATKAAISAGNMSDIRGCYPRPMRDSQDERIYLGKGLMTIISVMGSALTKAHKLSSKKKGAVLILDKDLIHLKLPPGVKAAVESSICIDWVSSDLPLSNDIAKRAGLETANAQVLLQKLRSYCEEAPVPPEKWVKATFSCISTNGA